MLIIARHWTLCYISLIHSSPSHLFLEDTPKRQISQRSELRFFRSKFCMQPLSDPDIFYSIFKKYETFYLKITLRQRKFILISLFYDCKSKLTELNLPQDIQAMWLFKKVSLETMVSKIRKNVRCYHL